MNSLPNVQIKFRDSLRKVHALTHLIVFSFLYIIFYYDHIIMYNNWNVRKEEVQ